MKYGSSATTFIDPDIDDGQIIFGGKNHEKHRRKSMVIPYRLILKIAILALIIFHNIDFIFAILILVIRYFSLVSLIFRNYYWALRSSLDF